jgi:hypothetical protein
MGQITSHAVNGVAAAIRWVASQVFVRIMTVEWFVGCSVLVQHAAI